MKLKLGSAVTALSIFSGITTQAESINYFEQGWSAEMRELFYFKHQGSHLMPVDWFTSLRTIDNKMYFSDPKNLSRFGFIASEKESIYNKHSLPIGFAIDPEVNVLGLTCAACHTANVEVSGQLLRVDGAPAHLDFDKFFQELSHAVALTASADDRFDDFASKVGTISEEQRQALRLEFKIFSTRLTSEAIVRKPAILGGPGRTDAFTGIINSIAVLGQNEVSNLSPSIAPTSYPALWLTSDLEFVQWNPIASSPIARNGGQVLGVFGKANLSAGVDEDAFDSTIAVAELKDLEDWLKELSPPKWNESLMGAIDKELAKEGANLFRGNCSSCHNMYPYSRTDAGINYFGKTYIEIGKVNYQEVGTDPTYIENVINRIIKTNDVTSTVFEGAEWVPAVSYFSSIVGKIVKRAVAEAGLTNEELIELNDYRYKIGEDGFPEIYLPVSLDSLKAGPLAAVWMTGPYLHNGSIPNIYELLSPVEERSSVFWTGGRELDTKWLGFVSTESDGRFLFDTSKPGNLNIGHEYPAGSLSHEERMAIIEYLKTQ